MGQSIKADHSQILMFPAEVERWVPANDPARFIREFVSELDLASMGFKVRPVGGAGTDHFSEELLLGIWLYGYFHRIRSSRKLEAALRKELPLIWLAGMHTPDHSSLWRFWDANKAALGRVFKETVLVADGMGMVGFALMAVDGTKELARGARRALWSERTLAAKEKALDNAIAQIEERIGSDTVALENPAIPAELEAKERLREGIRAQRAHLRQEGRKNIHPGEPDARIMKNHRTMDLAYNAQAVADSRCQIVTACAVSTDENDLGQLVPMIDEVVANLGRPAQETLADTGYDCEEQIALAAARGYGVLTKASPKRNSGQDRFAAAGFHYDPEANTLACPVNGTLLHRERALERKGTGVVYQRFRCRNKECPFREECSKQKKGKAVEIGPGRAAVQEQADKRRLPGSQDKIRQRAGIIEPVFAFAKEHGGFRRFTFGGLQGAATQWAMVMAGHNLRKMFKQWLANGWSKPAAAHKYTGPRPGAPQGGIIAPMSLRCA